MPYLLGGPRRTFREWASRRAPRPPPPHSRPPLSLCRHSQLKKKWQPPPVARLFSSVLCPVLPPDTTLRAMPLSNQPLAGVVALIAGPADAAGALRARAATLGARASGRLAGNTSHVIFCRARGGTGRGGGSAADEVELRGLHDRAALVSGERERERAAERSISRVASSFFALPQSHHPPRSRSSPRLARPPYL